MARVLTGHGYSRGDKVVYTKEKWFYGSRDVTRLDARVLYVTAKRVTIQFESGWSNQRAWTMGMNRVTSVDPKNLYKREREAA